MLALTRVRLVRGLAALILAACAGSTATVAGRTEPAGDAGSSAPIRPPAISAPSAPATAPTDASPPAGPGTATGPEIFARVQGDLAACYEEGRKAIPTMTSGRVTFHAAVDAAGRTTCVVPSDDMGLSQDVEACMRERLDRETYARTNSAWTAAVPIAVKDGTLGLGATRTTPPAIETIESHGLSEEVYDVVEALLPDLYGCMQGLDKSSGLRVVYVGGRVGKSGRVECALASSSSAVPIDKRECLANVLLRAKFKPPKRGYGLVSVPLNVFSRK